MKKCLFPPKLFIRYYFKWGVTTQDLYDPIDDETYTNPDVILGKELYTLPDIDNSAAGTFFDNFTPDQIVLKLVTLKEYKEEYVIESGWKRIWKKKGKVVVGAYKELLKLSAREFAKPYNLKMDA